MSSLNAVKLRMQNELAFRVHRRPAQQKNTRPIVSFTFDDFPRSAATVGGTMLANFGARGTYYAALGLMGTKTVVGDIFECRDLEMLLSNGHEVACHTFDHARCCDLSRAALMENCLTNRKRAADLLDGYQLKNFSFPLGVITPASKSALNSVYETCRTIEPGVNQRTIDLGYLLANRIYSRWGIEKAKKTIEKNARVKGWTILYTHDVSDRPSPYGCTPQEFRAVLEVAVQSGAEVLPVAEATKRFTGTSAGTV